MNSAATRKHATAAMGKEMSRDRTTASREAPRVKGEPVSPTLEIVGIFLRISKSSSRACLAFDTTDCSRVPGKATMIWVASNSCPAGSWKKFSRI